MTRLPFILLGLLSRHCRGPAAARKAWKVAADLRALGLDLGPQAILDAAADLCGQGFPVVATGGDVAALYLDDRRRTRGRDDWRAVRRTRGQALAVRPPAEARILAEAEKAYRGVVGVALAAAESAYMQRAQAAPRQPVMADGAALEGRGRIESAQVSARVRRAACGRRRGPRRVMAARGLR